MCGSVLVIGGIRTGHVVQQVIVGVPVVGGVHGRGHPTEGMGLCIHLLPPQLPEFRGHAKRRDRQFGEGSVFGRRRA